MYSMGILTAFGISFQKKTNLLYVLNGCINILAIATMSASQLVAAPGSDITLGCSFPHRDTDNIQNLIVNWQRGTTEVVHSYYHGKDQLDRQSLAYTGRTQLNPDELKKGNASLSLVGVQASDHGEYTCAVSNEQGSFRGNIFLKVAAPYTEPELAVKTTCDGFVVTLTSSHGFPEPSVQWSPEGIMNDTRTSLNSRGRYEVVSETIQRPSHAQRLEVEVKLEMLNQSFKRAMILHPLPACCVNSTTVPDPWIRWNLLLQLALQVLSVL